MKIYIFSDFHLGINEKRDREIEENFFRVLERIEHRSHIVLLGDIFDFWFEYKYVILKRNFTFLVRLWQLGEKFKFSFVCGNHDWWVRDFLPAFPMEVLKSHKSFEVLDKKILLAHGDGYFPRDPWGNALTNILRSSFISGLFYTLHPDIGYKIARGISKVSRHNSSQKKLPDEIPPKVLEHFEEGYNVVVLGHFHRPVFIRHSDKIYINAGSFAEKNTHIEITPENIYLRQDTEILYKVTLGAASGGKEVKI